MLNLPKSTQVNKMVAKNKFYERGNVDSALKNDFVNDIEKITWANKLSPETINLEAGAVKELEVFHIKLKNKKYNPKILETIDKAIPYHILYVLEHDGKYQLKIAYKEKSENDKTTAKTNITKYFTGEWTSDEPTLEIQAHKLDTVYQNLLSSLSEGIIDSAKETTLKEQVATSQEIDALQKQIDQLTLKMNREKQFNRQCEIRKQITNLEKQLKGLKNG